MKLISKIDGKEYGEVGQITNLKDRIGVPLFVGDIVVVAHKTDNWSIFSIVIWDSELNKAYVKGLGPGELCDEDINSFDFSKVISFHGICNIAGKGFNINNIYFD